MARNRNWQAANPTRKAALAVRTAKTQRSRELLCALDRERAIRESTAGRGRRRHPQDGGYRRARGRHAGEPEQAGRVRRRRTQSQAGSASRAARSVDHRQHAHREQSVAEGRIGRAAGGLQSHQRPARSRARGFGRPGADHQPGRAGRGQPELAEGRPARPGAARRFHPAREDHALRSRAHSGAHRACARLRRAWLLRVLRAADQDHARVAVCRSRQAHAGVRALLHRRRRARLDRHRARRARLRGEVLHRRRQLGSGRQQHPGVLHPGCDEVSGPRPRGEARAAPRHAAGGERARHVLGFRLADARIRRTCRCG